MAKHNMSLKAIKSSRAKTYFYQMLPIKKAGVDTNTFMVKVSDNKALQSKNFDCKGDLLEGIKAKLLPELYEEGNMVTVVVVVMPRRHKTYIVSPIDKGFVLTEKEL